jgi:hypothetical protein
LGEIYGFNEDDIIYDSIIVSPHSDSEREARPQNVDKIVQIMTFEFL